MLCNSSTYPPPLQLNQTPCDSDNAHHPSVPLHTLRTSAGIVHVPNISHHFLASHQCLPSQGSPDAQHGCHLALATSEASWWMKSALRLGVHSLIPNRAQHHVLQEHLVCVRRDSALLSLYCKIWRGLWCEVCRAEDGHGKSQDRLLFLETSTPQSAETWHLWHLDCRDSCRIHFIQYIASKVLCELQWQSSVTLDWSNIFITMLIYSLESHDWLAFHFFSRQGYSHRCDCTNILNLVCDEVGRAFTMSCVVFHLLIRPDIA